MDFVAAITIDLPFALRVSDGDYACSLDGELFLIHVDQVPKNNDQPRGHVAITMTPYTGHVDVGGIAHTRASVVIGQTIHAEAEAEAVTAKLRNSAVRFLNAFIDSYRHIFSDTKPYTLSPSDFFAIRGGLAPRITTKLTRADGHGTQTTGVTFGNYPATIRHEPAFEADAVQRFRNFLMTDARPPIVESLRSNARRFISTGEFRFAILEAGAAFDIAIEDAAKRVLSHHGLTTAPLDRMSSKAIVEQIIEPKVTSKILETAEWIKYDSVLRPLRNAVVHDGKEPSLEESQEFLETTSLISSRWV